MTQKIERTLKHAQFLARHIHSGLSSVVVAILIELDIPTNRDGFEYLKKAIISTHENPTRSLLKEVYADIAEEFGIDDIKTIDQAIVSAIELGWKARDEEVWACIFPSARFGRNKKPSNSEFITMIARFTELWEGCCKEANYEKV